MKTNQPNTTPIKDIAWTKEQYDAMQKKAHELGMHLMTPYRKNLKNIRVGVIKSNQSKG